MNNNDKNYDSLHVDYYKDIADNIKKYRKLHSLTQAELAEKMNMDSQYYAQLERFDNPIRHFTLDKILTACDIFNCTPNDIIGNLPIEHSALHEKMHAQIIDRLNLLSEKQLYVLLQYIERIVPLI